RAKFPYLLSSSFDPVKFLNPLNLFTSPKFSRRPLKENKSKGDSMEDFSLKSILKLRVLPSPVQKSVGRRVEIRRAPPRLHRMKDMERSSKEDKDDGDE
ncbi:hypothetical protein PFISCL1PPCAC_8150, partial [Pristionchus fissidentatus]